MVPKNHGSCQHDERSMNSLCLQSNLEDFDVLCSMKVSFEMSFIGLGGRCRFTDWPVLHKGPVWDSSTSSGSTKFRSRSNFFNPNTSLIWWIYLQIHQPPDLDLVELREIT